MEPEEGKYAWIYDENYKKLIQGALDRGLKLCFRIYDNGQDNIRQGTPEYVRAAGAQGYEVEGQNNAKLWTPYADDPIFQQKYEKFVAAFAKEYDNPDIVDFIDGHSLGWWGEGSHIKYLNSDKKKETFDWFTTMYSTRTSRISFWYYLIIATSDSIRKKKSLSTKKGMDCAETVWEVCGLLKMTRK